MDKFFTIYISVDFAHHKIFHAKVGKGGIILHKLMKYSSNNKIVLPLIGDLVSRCMGTDTARRYGGLPQRLLLTDLILSVLARANLALLIFLKKCSLSRSLLVRSGK